MTKIPLKPILAGICVSVVVTISVVIGFYLISSPWQDLDKNEDVTRPSDQLFGWQYPVAMFPEVGPISQQIAYSSIRDPGGVPRGLPVRLQVPTIGVDSAIEDALITPDGRMDVPYGSVNVAWFSLGPKPGQVGSAVIGGHFGIRGGVPFVFYDLDKLIVGDKIYILDDKGDTLAFIVRRIQLFDRNADATTVFTSNDGLAHLNLITCEGVWNQINGNYPQRRVVFTDAISEKTEAISVFNRTLSIGMRGSDVAVLQTILEQRAFLKMPLRVAKGYFGTLTRAAVIDYQRSVGLPSDGVFGLATRTKLISEQSSVAIKPTVPTATHGPTLPSTAITSPTYQVILDSIKSLFATPIDGLITFILLAAIIFTVFNIIRNRFKKLD